MGVDKMVSRRSGNKPYSLFLGETEKEGSCAIGEEFMNSLVELIVDVPVL